MLATPTVCITGQTNTNGNMSLFSYPYSNGHGSVSIKPPGDLSKILEKWKKRLRLQDWDIDISYAGMAELEDCLGTCRWTAGKKYAIIKILKPEERDTEELLITESIEQSIIHELLHLHLSSFCPDIDDPHFVTVEQAVHAIASCLMSLEDNDIHNTHAI